MYYLIIGMKILIVTYTLLLIILSIDKKMCYYQTKYYTKYVNNAKYIFEINNFSSNCLFYSTYYLCIIYSLVYLKIYTSCKL